jgi:hypothetical protein
MLETQARFTVDKIPCLNLMECVTVDGSISTFSMQNCSS